MSGTALESRATRFSSRLLTSLVLKVAIFIFGDREMPL